MANYLPQLGSVYATRQMIDTFLGYNANPVIGDNEFSDTQNLSFSDYPLLSTRQNMARVRTLDKANGMYAHESLCWVDGTQFYYGGQLIDGFALEDSPKTFVGMGAYVAIWPDKKWYNSKDGTFGSMENTVVTSGSVKTSICMLDGTLYEGYTASATMPENANDGDLWLDTGSTPNVLMLYSATYMMWQAVPTVYVKIESTGIGSGFSEYDGVTISGLENGIGGSHVIYGVGNDHIIVVGIIPQSTEQTAAVTIERTVPDMDFVTESENRIWGCSSDNHEIYACALGDFKNWNRFLGVSTDSYALTVGSPGDFTGAITHLGYVLFFKDDVIHKIYGNKPSNYQLTNTNARGVEKGSEKSLVIENETLYYKSPQDICGYNSSLPSGISDNLGKKRYTNASAGAIDGVYYISMEDDEGTPYLFSYDVKRGNWLKIDHVAAKWFSKHNGELYFINNDTDEIWAIGGTIDEAFQDDTAMVESSFDSAAVTGLIGLDSPDNKYISKLQLRLVVEAKAHIELFIQYDNGDWKRYYRLNATKRRSVVVPIIPRRCDTCRIKIVGKGSYRIYSLTKTIEQGSEIV